MSFLARQAVRFSRINAANLRRFATSVDQDFENAKASLDKLKDPGNEAKLKLYALFKQGTIGPCNAPKPGMMDFVGKAKWDAWNGLGSMSQEDAKKSYIEYVNGLLKNAA